MRHPSLRRAAGQGPVLVGTIGSLWPSWVLVGVGDGAAGLRDARQRDDPGQRGYQGLSWGAWTWVKDGITRGRYRAATAAAKPPGGIRGPEAVFWFQNELDQSVPWAPHPGDKGMGGLRWRGAPSSDGCRQGML